MELSTMYFSDREIRERMEKMGMLDGFPLPDDGFLMENLPIAAIARMGEGEEERAFFVITLPGESSDVREELWLNAMIEAGTSILEDDLRAEAEERGLMLSHQFAPGRGEIPFGFNRVILELTEAENLGIKLREEGTLSPQFTKSGVYVMGNEEVTGENYSLFGCGCPKDCSECRGSKGGCSLCARNFTKG